MDKKEIILKEMAKWYVENRRNMTEKDMEEIAQRLNVSGEDIKELNDYLGLKEGERKFLGYLREELKKKGFRKKVSP
jgi:CO/xanthine dehydrogenase Mo-binding subunit